ncbi:Uncharacterised protein [Achromobacter sp. 2789STDY5608633]|nr:Uncharacterised protein [Achromobacter sp. 2789STDY5608633]CUJ34319.1 Uncharacterised protein [Achromobacter sp. 2789STDY5608621]CUJ95502.1 Uncharacterised protein [Achromobacter sp. 2789STDY5608615]
MSAGAITTRLTSLAAGAPSLRDTGARPFSRSRYCSITLWMEYQNGIATVLPPSSLTLLMAGATVRPEPPTWFQATTLAGTWLPKRAHTVIGDSRCTTLTWPEMKASITWAQLRSSVGFSALTPALSNRPLLCATSSGAASVIGR